jgi:hypothetical protein
MGPERVSWDTLFPAIALVPYSFLLPLHVVVVTSAYLTLICIRYGKRHTANFFRCDQEVATDYSFTCLLRFMCVCSLSKIKIENFQPCAVRLGWNLVETSGWYRRWACMFSFQDFIVFYIVNEQSQNRGFSKLMFSLLCQVQLIWNLVGTSGQVLEIVWYVSFVYTIVCLHFINKNKENPLYGSFGHLQVKSFET